MLVRSSLFQSCFITLVRSQLTTHIPCFGCIQKYIAFIAAVGVGAICGALCRYQIGKVATEHISKDPKLKHLTGWHTAGINIIGSFILGGVFSTPLVATGNEKNIIQQVPIAVPKSNNVNVSNNGLRSALTFGSMTPRMKLLLGVGFCGSFSKFHYLLDLLFLPHATLKLKLHHFLFFISHLLYILS